MNGKIKIKCNLKAYDRQNSAQFKDVCTEPESMMNNRITHCIVCNKDKFKALAKYNAGNLVRCISCGMVFSMQKPDQTVLDAHYNGYAFFSGISPTTIKRYNELLDKFEFFRSMNRILDVGCGEGFFLDQAVRRAWDAYGTECVPHYIKICEDKGIHMKKGILNIDNYPSESFDVITSIEVLEHLNYPVQEIINFNSLLKKGGVVYITTPNFNSLSRRILGKSWSVINFPDHLCYFTPDTLHKIMIQNGFKKIELKTTGISFERIRQRFGKKKPETGKNVESQDTYQPMDMVWQERIEGNRILKLMKKGMNKLLTLTGTGDGIKALYIKK